MAVQNNYSRGNNRQVARRNRMVTRSNQDIDPNDPNSVDNVFSDSGTTPNLTQNQLAAYPAYIGGSFPSPTLTSYKDMKAAPYNFTDPRQFARQYGRFNRNQYKLNAPIAKDMALDYLDTELQGLRNFVPAASALKRQQTSIDNRFNQAERDAQIEATLPDARRRLEAQGDRAETYARGRAPDEITDRALELGVRSAAADNATYGGFGSRSSVARKTSDLMSAEQRLGLASYGENLQASNINQRANLLLAPTSYSDAAAQVRVTPEVGAGRMAMQTQSELTGLTQMSTTQAFQGTVQQEQYSTNLEQQTRTFNTSNRMSVDRFNAETQNKFKLSRFQYDAAYEGIKAGAHNAALNTELGLLQQQAGLGQFDSAASSAQNSELVTAGISALGTLGAAAISGSGSGTQPTDTTPTTTGVDAGATTTTAPPPTTTPAPTPSPTVDTTSRMADSGQAQGGGTGQVVGRSATAVPSTSQTTGQVTPSQGHTPSAYNSPEVSSFVNRTGNAVPDNSNVTRALVNGSNVVMAQAGVVTGEPASAMEVIGYNQLGRPVAHMPALSNQAVGTLMSSGLQAYNVMGEGDASKLNDIVALSENPEVMAKLDNLAGKEGDGFIKEVLKDLGIKDVDSSKYNSDLQAAFTANSLKDNWGNMNNDQKKTAIASLGTQAFKFEDGSTIATKKLPQTQGNARMPELTVAQAAAMEKDGINSAAFVNKYNTYSELMPGLVAPGKDGKYDPKMVASQMQALGLLGKNSAGAAVDVNTDKLEAEGFTALPSVAPGAIKGPGDKIPEGYRPLYRDRDGQVVAVVEGSEGMTASNVFESDDAGNPDRGIYKIYRGWEQAPYTNNKGTMGGSATATGLNKMSTENPYMLGSMLGAKNYRNMVESDGPAPVEAGGPAPVEAGGTSMISQDRKDSFMAAGQRLRKQRATQASRNWYKNKGSD